METSTSEGRSETTPVTTPRGRVWTPGHRLRSERRRTCDGRGSETVSPRGVHVETSPVLWRTIGLCISPSYVVSRCIGCTVKIVTSESQRWEHEDRLHYRGYRETSHTTGVRGKRVEYKWIHRLTGCSSSALVLGVIESLETQEVENGSCILQEPFK